LSVRLGQASSDFFDGVDQRGHRFRATVPFVLDDDESTVRPALMGFSMA
jgi:hypothetical protein